MKNIFTITLISTVLILRSSTVESADKYTVIAEASIPALTRSAQSLSKFADKVSKGSSMLIAGGVIALAFQIHDADITSGVRIFLFSDVSGKNPTPLIAFAVKPAGNKVPDKIKFNKYKFPIKKIGTILFVAETESLLNAVKEIPPQPNTESDLFVRLYPEKYFKQCHGTLEAFKSKIDQELSKGRKKKTTTLNGDIKALQGTIEQCRLLDISVKTATDRLTAEMAVTPVPGTAMAKIISSNKGKLSQKDIINLAGDIAGTQNFVITDEIKSSIAFLLGKIFSDSDTAAMAEKLCRFSMDSTGSKLNISASVTPEQTKEALSIAGALKDTQ